MTNKVITVSDIMFSPFFYVWCDLDGDGLKWELATRTAPDKYTGTTIAFYQKGFENEPFTDFWENYSDYPAYPVEPPEPIEV